MSGALRTYPVFLVNLEGRRAVVLGGDEEAARKARELVECDARVVVIHPTLCPSLGRLVDDDRVAWVRRAYRTGDLDGAFLVIAARGPDSDNAAVHREATLRGTLINAMDDVRHCNFIAGSTLRRGPLVVSISTGGAAPALAVRLRQRFASEIGEPYGELLERLAALREPMRRRYPDFEERRRAWYRLVDALLDRTSRAS